MPKDYARYPFKPRPGLFEQGWVKRLLVVMIAIGFVGAVGSAYYFSKNVNTENLKVTQVIARFKAWRHPRHEAPIKALIVPIAEHDPTPEVHFDFYTELPRMKVKVTETEDVPKPSSLKVAPHFIIAFGTYADESIASERRLSLLLAGLEVDLVKWNEGGKMQFLLQQGPFMNKAEAEKAQERLKRQGIDSTIKRSS